MAGGDTISRGVKSSGFNIEDTHVVKLDHLEKLILLVMIAFVWCYLIGDYIDRRIWSIQIKKHGRRAGVFPNMGWIICLECCYQDAIN